MKFKTSECPECGEKTCHILENVQILTCIKEMEDGSFGWDEMEAGEVMWDSSSPDMTQGRYTLYCPEGHHWESE